MPSPFLEVREECIFSFGGLLTENRHCQKKERRMQFPLKNPQPDFEELKKVLKGEKKPQKVHFTEIVVDGEVMEYMAKEMMGTRLFYAEAEKVKQEKIDEFKRGREVILLTDEDARIYTKRSVEFYCRMGYDYFTVIRPNRYLMAMTMPKVKAAKDTATLPRKGTYSGSTRQGSREWIEEGAGVISSWEDFEKFPWERMKLNLESYFDFLDRNLPGVTVRPLISLEGTPFHTEVF